MRDGQGNKLPPDEQAKVGVAKDAGSESLNRVSVDPAPAPRPAENGRKDAEPPKAEPARGP